MIQELGREGVLPFAALFSSNKPFNAPLAALVTQWVFSCTFVILPPPGDAYLFMISRTFFPSLVNDILIRCNNSVLVFPCSHQHTGILWATLIVRSARVGPTLPSPETCSGCVLPFECLSCRCAFRASQRGGQNVRAFAVLGELSSI